MARDEAQLLAMGERIRELRDSHGLKQQTIADHCGVKLRTYQFWQEGKHPPSQEALEKLAKLFDVTPQYILRGAAPSADQSDERLTRIEEKLDRLLAASSPDGLTAQQHVDLEQLEDLLARLEGLLREQPPAPPAAAEPPRAGDKPAA